MKWMLLIAILAVMILPITTIIHGRGTISGKDPDLDKKAAIAVLEARVEIIKSEIALSQICIDYHKRETDRLAKLITTGSVPDQEYMIQNFELEKARGELIRNQARHREICALLEYAKTTGVVDPIMTAR
jgi:hypothetical protein